MKKRRLIPVLCAAAVAVSLAGCSGSSGSATEKGADTQAPKAEAGAETYPELQAFPDSDTPLYIIR